MIDTYISYLCKSLYIQSMQKLVFHLPHVLILGTKHCGNTCRQSFKRHSAKQYVLCRHDYSERVVASFAHQI